MKKIYFLAMISFLAIATVFTSCSKEDDNDEKDTPKTKTELLTVSKWKMTAFTVNPAVDGQTDLYASMEDCEKDDTFKFNTNGTYTSYEENNICEDSEPQESGTWSFNSTKTELLMDNDLIFTIVSLTDSKCVISMQREEEGTTYTYTKTFTH